MALTGANEAYNGRGGNDNISGLGGNDCLLGDSGSDNMQGGSGNDNLQGGAGEDTLQGGDGMDDITGGPSSDKVMAGSGNDIVNVRDGARRDGQLRQRGGHRLRRQQRLGAAGLRDGPLHEPAVSHTNAASASRRPAAGTRRWCGQPHHGTRVRRRRAGPGR